ncbi:protein transport protein S31 [Elasticomyces elasticus]|nr:protein transport protein S31 [Elasticomyces elasticus]
MAKSGSSSATTGKKVGGVGAGGKMGQPVSATTARATQGLPPVVRAGSVQPVQQPLINQARNAPSPYAPAGVMQQQQQQASNPYAPPAQLNNNYTPAGYQPAQQQSGGLAPYGGYQPPAQQAPLPPPPRAGTASPSVSLKPAAATKAAGDWNDMPANFFPNRQPGSRRGTPAPQTYPNVQQPAMASPPVGGYGQPPRQAPAPLPPPPKAGERVMSPPAGSNQPPPLVNRPSSSAASAYAPPASQMSSPQPGNTLPTPMQPPVARGASPYQPPPATSHAPTTNRYAPAPGSTPSHVPGQQRQVAPNPYAQPTPNLQYGNGGEGQGRAGQYAPAQQPQQGAGYGAPPMQQQGYSQQAPPPPMSGGGSLGYGAPPPQGQYAAQQAQAGTPYGQPPSQQQQQPPPPPAAAAAPPPRGPPRNATPSGPPASSRPQPVQQQSEALLQNQPPSQQVPQQKPKHPKGDRSHIPPSARPIVDILTPEVLRIKSVAPQTFKPQVDDMEKRINILFDHLNNGDLLSQATVEKVVEISRAVEARDWARATGLLGEMQGVIGAEGGLWIAGVKRLINIGKATSK